MGEVPQHGGGPPKWADPLVHCGSEIQTGSHLGRLEGQLVIRHHAVNTCAPLSIQMNMSD